jgi:hypothetical protein
LTDDEFAALDATERDFAIRWSRMTDDEQEWFRDQLLSALAVLRRLGAIDPNRSDEPAEA